VSAAARPEHQDDREQSARGGAGVRKQLETDVVRESCCGDPGTDHDRGEKRRSELLGQQPPWEGSSHRSGLSLRSVGAVELGEQRVDAPGDLVAGCAHGVDRLPFGVFDLPVEVALAWDLWAGVSGSHRDHDIGPLGELPGEQLRRLVTQVDSKLVHHRDHFRVDLLGGRGSRRACLVRFAGARLNRAWLIWERPALCTHTNRT
jgi:hypothetical protein